MTEEDVIKILKLIEESRFSELQLEVDDFKLMVKKESSLKDCSANKLVRFSATSESEAAEGQGEALLEVAKGPVSTDVKCGSDRQVDSKNIEAPDDGQLSIVAPLLGIFYRSPEPGTVPFVEVGSLVEEDTTVCLIEVMKMFNSVKAGVRGRISSINVNDGEMVEYGQSLFYISPE